MYGILYVEINLFCVALLLYVIFIIRASANMRSAVIAFRRTVVASIAVLIFDSLRNSLELLGASVPAWLFSAVCGLYMLSTGILSYCWFVYTENKLNRGREPNRKALILASIPLIVFAAICVSSPWTGLVYYVDGNAVCHPGSLFFTRLIVCYGYLAAASIHALYRFVNDGDRTERTHDLTLASFVVLPAAGSALAALVHGLPAVWPATTFSLLMVFVNFQVAQISTDGLTGLNNRRKFDEHLRAVLSDTHRSKLVYLFLADINYFKSINDTFGHLEGDAALVRTGALLQGVCGSRDAFIARYGGDEFAVILRCDSPADMNSLLSELDNIFHASSEESGKGYELSLCVGHAVCAQDQDLAPDELIAAADSSLYAAKAEYQSSHASAIRAR